MVTRGNVAIYCYNALTAKMWDVTESTNGELTSSKTADTILAKYFSDFVNGKGKMKLVEDAKIVATGATTTTIGANQIKVQAEGLVDFINAEKAPKRGEEEVTYYVKSSTDTVVAYVPSTVANVATLLDKTVDIIFGKDNEVAYLLVTNDSVDNSYVTAWDYDSSKESDSTIEIDGEEYEFASKVKVSVYNYVINEEKDSKDKLTYADGIKVIEKLLKELKCVGKNSLTRSIVADYELDADDEIESINFKFSAKYENGVKVEEKIVEKVTAKKFEYATGSESISSLEDKDPRVVKNDEVASLEDIEAGDVLTFVTKGSDLVIYATSNTVEGALTDYTAKTNALEIDGTEYKVVATPYFNKDGEIDDYSESTGSKLLNDFEDEDVVAYMNMFGEVVAVVGESEATGRTLGVITDVPSKDEDNGDVEYLKVKILAENGTNKSYKIYNSKTNKNISKAEEWGTIGSLGKGDVIVFSANADRVIKSDDIELVKDNETYDLSDSDLTAIVVSDATATTNKADIDNKRLTVDLDTYKYTSSTVIINYNDDQKELISWEALTNDAKNNDLGATGEMTLFVKGTKLMYVVADVAKLAYGKSEDMYGIVTNLGRDTDEDGDRIYTVTVLVEGNEETYECTSKLRENLEVGDLIKFNVSDDSIEEEYDKITNKPKDSYEVIAYYDLVEALEDLVDGEKLPATALDLIDTVAKTDLAGKNLDYIKVDAADAESIEFKYEIAEVVCENCKKHLEENLDCVGHTPYVAAKDAYRIVDLDDDCIVYNLVTGEMGKVDKGDYALVVDTDNDKDIDIVIIVK